MTQKKWHRGGIIDLFQIFSQFIHSIWYYSTYWWDKFCISFSSPRKKAKKSESDSHRTVSNHITILLNQRNDSSFLILIEKSDFRCNLLLYKSSTTWKSHIEVYFFTSPSSEKKSFDFHWYTMISMHSMFFTFRSESLHGRVYLYIRGMVPLWRG